MTRKTAKNQSRNGKNAVLTSHSRGSSQGMPSLFRPVIGLAMERTIPYADDVFWNLIGLAQQGYPFIRQPTVPIDLARNRFAKYLLDTEYTHLIILDIDHVHPPDLVRKFAVHVEKYPEHLVIGALNFRRGQPYDPLAFIYEGEDVYSVATWEPGEIVRVDALGTNEVCIHRSVFEQLPYPWFFRDYSVQTEDGTGLSEDLVFCRALRKAGIEIWLDTGITNDHLITGKINEAVFRAYCEQFVEVKENGRNKETSQDSTRA